MLAPQLTPTHELTPMHTTQDTQTRTTREDDANEEAKSLSRLVLDGRVLKSQYIYPSSFSLVY